MFKIRGMDFGARALALFDKYYKKHNLAVECGSEYIYQNDKAQEDAIELVSTMFDYIKDHDKFKSYESSIRLFKHKKGGLYELMCEGTNSETLEEYVVYKSVIDNKIWIRPRGMFYDGRFIETKK